jgi:hypothetical protein
VNTRSRKLHRFVENVVSRACALQSFHLKRPAWIVEVDGSFSWQQTALAVTAAATDAYIRDRPLQLSGDVPAAVSQADGACDMKTGCLFRKPNAAMAIASEADPQNEAQNGPDVWHAQRIIDHYLRGAGLLWLRRRTNAISGCHLAAAFARLHLQPSGTFGKLLDSTFSEVVKRKHEKVVVINVDSLHTSLEEVGQVLEDDNSTGAPPS